MPDDIVTALPNQAAIHLPMMTGSLDEKMTPQKPKVLFVSTEMWLSTARQSMVLASLGCEITLLAPPSHPALLTGAISEWKRHDPVRPLKPILKAIAEVQPDSVIPADERTVIHIQEIWVKLERSEEAADIAVLKLLEKSFGSREALFAGRSRMTVLRLATEENVAIPPTVCVDREEDLAGALNQLGLPLVLKADMTSGGDGVHVVETLVEAQKSWKKLHYPPNLARVIRRGVLFKNWAHLRSWAKREKLAITAQKFIPGSERTSMAVCHKGKVLASACLEVAKTWQVRGPSSVLRVVDDPEMERAIERVAARLHLSGFCGFDFMIPEDGGALLIEMNPRPTQTAHLALGPGHDLIAAYVRGVLGFPAEDRPAAPAGDTVALFPQELIRDANSEFIATAYHDVPWDSPALMRQALKPLPSIITQDPRWRG